MISQKARYAFKALLALTRAGQGRSLQTREIATVEQIPQSFLEQILIVLKRAGLVGSRRGPEGGHFLIKDPAAISFGQVLRLIDGPVAPLPCLSRTAYRRCEDCTDEATCGVRKVFGEAYDATLKVLERTTVADAAAHPGDALLPAARDMPSRKVAGRLRS